MTCIGSVLHYCLMLINVQAISWLLELCISTCIDSVLHYCSMLINVQAISWLLELCEIAGETPSAALRAPDEVEECEQEQKKLERTAKVCHFIDIFVCRILTIMLGSHLFGSETYTLRSIFEQSVYFIALANPLAGCKIDGSLMAPFVKLDCCYTVCYVR